MTLGEILDRTFQIYRARFLVFVGIAAFPAVAMLAVHFVDLGWLHVASWVHPWRQRGVALWTLIVSLFFFHLAAVFGTLVVPAYVKQVSSLLSNTACSLGGSVRFVCQRWRSYLWLTILKVGVVVVLPEGIAFGGLVAAALILDAMGALNGEQKLSAFLVLFVVCLAGGFVFIWLGMRLALTFPVAAIEVRSGFGALKRSWQLSREGRLRIFGAWGTAICLGAMASLILQLLLRLAFFAISHRAIHVGATPPLYLQSRYLLGAVISSLIGPLYPIALTLIYYDQRIRREGYDIELMMNAAGWSAPELVSADASALVTATSAEDARA